MRKYGRPDYSNSGKEDLITKIKISPETSIKEALKKIDATGMAVLFVCEEGGSLLGSLTDGDIRRRVLATGDLQEEIANCFNRNPVFVREGNYVVEDVKKLMLAKTVEVIPVIGRQNKVVDVLFWIDIFDKDSFLCKKIDIPIVIMAGGKGERLGPFTKIFPKALIPIGEKPIIEIIIDRFRQYDVKDFYISLNYKGDMIRNYFESINKDYKVEYIQEKEFLGTAGSLKLMPSDLADTFMVSNCDIVVDIDYRELLSFHHENNNILSVVGSIQHHRLPYGVVHFEEKGKVKKIQEKPEFDFTVNTGMYVLSRKAISYIPDDKHLDMTDLIQILLDNKENVGVYPVSQKSYIDIGQWEEYKKAIDKVQLFI